MVNRRPRKERRSKSDLLQCRQRYNLASHRVQKGQVRQPAHIVPRSTEKRSRRCPLKSRSFKAICLSRSGKCGGAKLLALRKSKYLRPPRPERGLVFHSKSLQSFWVCQHAHFKTGSKVAESPQAQRKHFFESQFRIPKFFARCTRDAHHSIERTVSGLRPPTAAYVERWASERPSRVELQVILNTFASDVFRRQADFDYIAARANFRMQLQRLRRLCGT